MPVCSPAPAPALSSRVKAVSRPLPLLSAHLPGTPASYVCVSDHVVITHCDAHAHVRSSLPASGTSVLDPCLLTSPEVTLRVVTHSAPAPTCTYSCPEPPSLWRGKGTGQPFLRVSCYGSLDLAPVWLMGSCLGLGIPLGGPWLLLPSRAHGPRKDN